MRLNFHALAYNLANFMRALALPKDIEHWSLTTLREKLLKIGAGIVRHGRYVVLQLAKYGSSGWSNAFRIHALASEPAPNGKCQLE